MTSISVQPAKMLEPKSASLLSPSFQSLLWTNWLTAINDNIFRWLAIGVGKDFFEPQHQGSVLMAGTACFVLPFILFAAPAGYLADRFSKRNVIVGCKFLEIIVMLLGVTAIYMQNFSFLLVTVFMMGAQSALFAPAKIGSIPEMMGQDRISKANGFFNLSSLTATIIGMAIGGWVSDVTGYRGVEYYQWLPALVLVGIAILGTFTSIFMQPMPAQNPKLKFPLTMFSEMWRDQRLLFKNKALFSVALGIIFFWSVAALGQLNIDQFAEESGGLFESHRTPLLISLILGVGIGSVLAGFLSMGRIELGLVPWGALGISFFCFLLYISPAQFIDSNPGINPRMVIGCTMLGCLGISAGFFQIPLASYLQYRSPAESRGSILSAVNCLIFSGMLLVSLLYWGLRAPVYEGKFINIPANYQSTSLPEDQRLEFHRLVAEYRVSQQSLAEFIDAIDDETIRDEVLRQVNWNRTFGSVVWLVNSYRQDASLTAEQQNEIDQLVSEFESSQETVAQFTNRMADSPLRDAVLAKLTWDEMKARQTVGKRVELKDYFARYNQKTQQNLMRVIKETQRQTVKIPLFSSRQVFLIMGLMAVPIFIYATYRLPHAMVRIFLWWAVKIFYRIRVVGIDHIPKNGGAILVSNHVSTFDGILFLLMTSRTTRMLAWAGNFANPVTRFLAKFSRTILMTGGPKSIQRGLADARKALARGELVGMFPEGGLSRTGGIQSFKPGLMKVLDKMPVPIVPVYIDEMWGSNLTWANQGSIFRIPKRFRQPITVNIGPPFTRSDSIHEIRQAVQKLGAEAVQNRQSTFLCPAQKFIRSAKKRKFKFKLGCSTGQEATGGALLMRVLILRRLLNRHVLPDRNVEKNIGVLLPPSFGAVAVNLALGLDRRVAVNLNYTVSSDILNICIKQAKIKRVLTSKKVWEKFDYQLDAEIVFVEELKDKVTTGDKLAGLIGSYVTPAILLERQLHLHECKENDVLTIIFTSGSTGIPKGVLLTHGNVASNVEAIDEVINLDPRDTMIGILPLFHSMGYTVTMWAPMGLNVAGAYHFNPLDARQIGKLTQKYGGTVLLGTPTFLRSYVRRISPEEFSTLDTVVAGAEHLPKDLCDAFERKFGVRPVEGYGTTELSPLVSVNVPPSRSRKNFQIDCKEGTVGRPIPNVAAKITDLDDDSKELDKGEPGMLWITGPNVMAGYLNNPEATAAVLINGWYNTGDVALIDKDGFIQITGRISRFSKIGGEMVPHVQIEETLNEIVGEDVDDDGEIDEMKIAVSAVPHPKKGERIVVLHTKIKQDIHDLCKQLSVRGLPNIYIPSADSFVEVEALPMLGSGKLDLKKLKMMAEELFAGSNSTK